MTTRVTLPPLDPTAAATDTHVPVAKVQLLNDRGDRQAEAAWLTAAARPGVVELLSTSDEPFTIVTAHAGARTMRTARLDPNAGLAVMTQVTELLSDLHRDGFVHGKLTVDHVIIGSNGPALCSPDGTVTEPAVDLDGVARCMRELARQWDEAKSSSPWRPQWDDIAQRLEDGTDPSRSAVRTTHALQRIGASSPTVETAPSGTRSSRGLAAAALIVVVAVAGVMLVPTNTPAISGPHIVVDGSVYAVGQDGDDVSHLENPCDPNAPVVTLRPSTGEVWAFRSVGDGATSEPVAVVPGATGLRREQRMRGEDPCDVAVARGPAGASVIDTAALLSNTSAGQDLSTGGG